MNAGGALGGIRGRAIAVTLIALGGMQPIARAEGPIAGVDATLPPAFNVAQQAGLATIFSSCQGPIGQIGTALQEAGTAIGSGGSLTSGLGALGGIGVSMNTVCPSAATPGEPKCEDFSSAAGFDRTRFQSFLSQLTLARSSAVCEKAKIEAIRAEITCLQAQAQALAQQIATLQQVYVTNINRMQQDVAQIKQVEADRAAQLEDVNQRLNGGAAGGQVGLLETKRKIEELIGQMPTEVLEVRQKFENLQKSRQALEEQIQTQTMAKAGECFKTRTQSNFRCSRNGPPVSALEYVKCRFEQNQFLGEEGVIERDKATENRAKGNAQALASVLDTMLADMPTVTRLPADPEAALQEQQQNTNILSAADIESQYGDSLASFNGQGLDIHDFVTKAMGLCIQRAARETSRDRKRTNSAIGVTQLRIKQEEEQVNRLVDERLQKYSNNFSDAMQALTGQSLPLNTSACVAGNPSTQIGCLEDMKSNMQGLLSGTSRNSAVSMNIRGSLPATNISFSCNGLNGCISKLQNVSRNLDTEKTRLKSFREDYVLKAKQSVDRFTKTMAQTMSGQNAALKARMDALNSAMSSMGASPVDIQPIAAEEPQFDEDGLPLPPTNVLALIGSQMNPPMLDVVGNNFSSGLSGLSTKQEDIDRRMGEVASRETTARGLAARCEGARANELAQSLQTDISQLTSQQCGSVAGCGDQQTLTQLLTTINGVNPVPPGLEATTVDSLSSGIRGACSAPTTTTGALDGSTALPANCRPGGTDASPPTPGSPPTLQATSGAAPNVQTESAVCPTPSLTTPRPTVPAFVIATNQTACQQYISTFADRVTAYNNCQTQAGTIATTTEARRAPCTAILQNLQAKAQRLGSATAGASTAGSAGF